MDIKTLEPEINWLHERICYALGDPKTNSDFVFIG